MANFTAPLPPSRATGDAPSGGPAADVNLLTAAVTEARGIIKTPAEIAADAALSGTYQQIVGAPTGNSTTDVALLTAAVNALPAAGGTLMLARGDYDVTAGWTVNKRVRLVGQGAGNLTLAAPTRLVSTSTTADAITISADGCQITDLCIVNTATSPTAGAGIRITAGSYTRLVRTNVAQFYDNVSFESGSYWSMSECSILDPVRYGLRINCGQGGGDYGDMTVHACHFSQFNLQRPAAAAVRYESGGGLRFINNKIVSGFGGAGAARFVRGFDLAIKDAVSTSVLLLESNSVEGCTEAGIRIGHLGPAYTGTFAKMIVTGNELLGPGSLAAIGIDIQAGDFAHANYLRDILVASNVMYDLATGINLQNVTAVTLGTNQFSSSNTGAVLVTTPVSIGNGVVACDIARQSYGRLAAGDLIKDAHASTATPGQRLGVLEYLDQIDLNASGQNVWSTMWQFDLPGGGSVSASLEIDGVQSDGASTRPPFVLRQDRAVLRNQGGTSIAVSTIGTDFLVGSTTIAVQWTATTTTLTVQVSSTDATLIKVLGVARLNLRGMVSRLHRGA